MSVTLQIKHVYTVSIIAASLSTSAFAQTFMPDYNYLDEQFLSMDISATEGTMTVPELVNAGEKSLYARDFISAERMFSSLKLTGEQEDFAIYGLAVSLGQQGKFQNALDEITPLAVNNGEYTNKARELRGELLIRLADLNIQNKNYTAAKNHLMDFMDNHRNHSRSDKAESLFSLTNDINQNVKNNKLSSNNTLRVGLLFPLSGDLKPLGEDLLRAAQNALFDYSNQNILLYPEDTQGTMEGARTAMNNVVKHGANIVIGPLLADNVRATQDIADNIGIPQIALSSDMTVANRNTFLQSYQPHEQAQQIARHAYSQGKRKFAVLLPETPYGQEMAQFFRMEIEALGGEMVREVAFDPTSADIGKALNDLLRLHESRRLLQNEKDFLTKEHALLAGAMDDASLTRLQELAKISPEAIVDFDALFVPAPAQNMPLIASQLAFYDFDESGVLLLGTALWDSPMIIKNRGEYMQGALFPAPQKAGQAEFQKQFKNTYKSDAHPLAALTYDAVKLVTELYQDGKDTANRLRSALSRPDGFTGITGAFRFYANGQAHRNYDVKQVGRKLTVVAEAPKVLPPELPQTLQASTNFWGNNNPSYDPDTYNSTRSPKEEKKDSGGWFWWGN